MIYLTAPKFPSCAHSMQVFGATVYHDFRVCRSGSSMDGGAENFFFVTTGVHSCSYGRCLLIFHICWIHDWGCVLAAPVVGRRVCLAAVMPMHKMACSMIVPSHFYYELGDRWVCYPIAHISRRYGLGFTPTDAYYHLLNLV